LNRGFDLSHTEKKKNGEEGNTAAAPRWQCQQSHVVGGLPRWAPPSSPHDRCLPTTRYVLHFVVVYLLSLTSGLLRESPQVSVVVGAAEQLARIPHNSWDTVAWGRRGPTSRQLGSSAPAMTATGVTVPPLYSPLIHAPATRRVEPAFLAARSKIRGVQIRV
jgi:hypothetical protein